jgi:hypothetical protein
MLKWPERAKGAIRALFEPLQEIDVYVEDINDEPFYRALLNTVSQGKITVARVFALGGRKEVIGKAKAHDNTKRRALFIIDGDLEWVRGIPPENVVGLHQHDAYCIENLLYCEKALIHIFSQELVMTEDEASSKLDLNSWLASIQTPLLELFSAFATVHEFYPQTATVSQGVGNLCTPAQKRRPQKLDIAKVTKAKDLALKAAETKTTELAISTTYSQTLARLAALDFPLHAVSGKNFLLPLIDFLLQTHGCRIKRKSLRMRMASAGDINRFSRLYNALHLAALGN